MGDWHKGSGNHNAFALKKTITTIKDDPQAYCILMGDLGDFIFWIDKRFSANSEEKVQISDLRMGAMGQVRKICDDLEPIKNKILLVHTGNHEEKIANMGICDPTREIAERLNIPYGGWSALTQISVTGGNAKSIKYSVTGFTGHGYGGGRKSGSKINKIEDAAMIANADFYAMAHVHGLVASKNLVMQLSVRGELQKRERAFMITGSYLETAKVGTLNYGEKAFYPECSNGSPCLQITGDAGRNEFPYRMEITI